MNRTRSVPAARGRFRARGVLAALLLLTLAPPVAATNGSAPHGIGTRNKAMGGAGIAAPDEAIAFVMNPATAGLVAGRFDAGVALFQPKSNYLASEKDTPGLFGSFTVGPHELEAEDRKLYAPFVAASWRIGEDSALAVSLRRETGLDTEYRGGTATFDPDGAGPLPIETRPGSLGDGDVRVKTSRWIADVAWSHAFSERYAAGVAAVLVSQSFSATGFGAFASLTETYAASVGATLPDALSGNGSDSAWGYGLKLGVHAQWTPRFATGFMVQSPIRMGRLDDYADLLPDRGRYDQPAHARIGFSWQALDSLLLSFDVEHVFFSDVDALGNSLDDLFECPTAGRGGNDLSRCLGGSNGGALGWDDDTILKFGLEWRVTPAWALWAGYSIGHQPIPISDMNNNLFTPYLADIHYTAGAGWRVGGGHELRLALMYVEEESMNERNRFDFSQYFISEASQFEIEISYGFSF